MNILIISAHPDDETIGMGGTILKLARANQVYWQIMTRAFYPKWSRRYIASKEKEIESVGEYYGIKRTFVGKFKAASLSSYPQQEICENISTVLKKVKPTVVYVPPLSDCHTDHEITANALLSVARPWNGYDVERIYSYELPVTTSYSEIKGDYSPYNCFENITSEIGKKLIAMDIYKTELKTLPHPRSLAGLKTFAQERGLRSGYTYAEAFRLLYARNS